MLFTRLVSTGAASPRHARLRPHASGFTPAVIAAIALLGLIASAPPASMAPSDAARAGRSLPPLYPVLALPAFHFLHAP